MEPAHSTGMCKDGTLLPLGPDGVSGDEIVRCWKAQDIRKLLRAGADKVSSNAAAVANPEFVREAVEIFGSQCIVVAIDANRVQDHWEVFTHGGRNATGIDACAWAERTAGYGAGEILLTSMDRDGTKDGSDLPMTRAISDRVSIPVK